MGEVFNFFNLQNEKYPLKTKISGQANNTTTKKKKIAKINLEAEADINFPLLVNRGLKTIFIKFKDVKLLAIYVTYFINKSKEYIDLDTNRQRDIKSAI